MDVLSPFISVLCHSDWLFHGESCPRLDVAHPGRAWSSSPARTCHCFVALSLSLDNSLVSSWCDHSRLASSLWRCLTYSSLFTPLLRTHSFVFFAVYETHRIFLSPFISKASRHVSSFFLRVQLSQPYVTTGHTSTLISRIFVEIGMLWLFHIFAEIPRSPAPCLTWYGIVIRDPRYGNVSTRCSSSLWMSMRHAMQPLAITLVLSTLMSKLI